MACQRYQEQLGIFEDYVEGRLPEDERSRLVEHFAVCEICREAIESAELATRILRNWGIVPVAEPSTGFARRVVARLRVQQESAADFWRSLEVLAWRLSWTAAALLIVLGGYLWMADLIPHREQLARQETTEVQEIFPEPYQRPVNQEEVLLSLTSNGSGR
jgi:arginine/ornithine N-succinyltransferase beta subunit